MRTNPKRRSRGRDNSSYDELIKVKHEDQSAEDVVNNDFSYS